MISVLTSHKMHVVEWMILEDTNTSCQMQGQSLKDQQKPMENDGKWNGQSIAHAVERMI
jgi:hypothetical protein